MGLILASLNAATKVVGDQFKEVVKCPASDQKGVIIQRGVVEHGSGNLNPTEGIISAGSKIIVPQGMAMMVIEDGKVVEFTAEPGDFIWDKSSEPSIFTGKLSESIINTIKTIGQRITYGGHPAKDQRVYYVNIKTITGNTFGSQQPEVIADPVYGSVEVTYNGEFSFRVDDPVVLVNGFIGANPMDTVTFDDIFTNEGENQLKSKFVQKISEAIARVMVDEQVSFNIIQTKKSAITDVMNDLLDEEWGQRYGIVIDDVSLRINASEEAKERIAKMDTNVATTKRMSELYGSAQAYAAGQGLLNASENANGAMGGFVGYNMAGAAGQAVTAGAVSGVSGGQTPVKKCPECNVDNKVSAKFCTECGHQFE
ncbi:MAG: SPFH domain-containing protein [Bacilli bacterium]|nr:SPFH domain-containing protein [Bacilli bacterium]